MGSLRTITCGQPRKENIGSSATICGWVNSRRDHGGVIFIDLRDHTGLMQIVFEPGNAATFAVAEKLRPEHVVRVTGSIRARPDDTANLKLDTGEVELVADTIEHINASKTPAFLPDDVDMTEDTKLAHRVMHLRTSAMQKSLRTRHKMASAVRKTLEEQDFIEVETPILTKSTPEGARDFLVPARNTSGHFYALPQSPQLFKQILMIGGIDRYYQFARCFRDEDLRADRQPEFTQIDIEMAFATDEDVMAVTEQVFNSAWQAAGLETYQDIQRLTFASAMQDYGCDTPDLSIDTKLHDIADILRGCNFKVFAEPASQPGSRVVALNTPKGSELSRKQIDDLTEYVRKLGASGLAYIKVDQPGAGVAGISSPIAKFLDDKIIDEIVGRCQSQAGDLLFFGAGPSHVVNGYMAPLRVKLGHELKFAKAGHWPVWVTDFPLFLKDPETGKLLSYHHPFTAPTDEDTAALLEGSGLEELMSVSYDLVVNGMELGGGSIRIHREDVQLAALKALGIDMETAREQFGFLLDSLQHGAPPHGGVALGFDRMAAMAAGTTSIRDVIAFPKTQTGACKFTQAPQPVEAKQLTELGLSVRKKKQESC